MLVIPDTADEVRMLQNAVGSSFRATDEQPILELQQLNRIQESVAALTVASSVQDYLVRLAHETAPSCEHCFGTQSAWIADLATGRHSRAWLSGRTFVTPDDVQDVAQPVLSVRLGLEPTEASSVIQEILSRVPVPEYQA